MGLSIPNRLRKSVFGAIQLERHFVERRVTEMLPIKDGTLTTVQNLKTLT